MKKLLYYFITFLIVGIHVMAQVSTNKDSLLLLLQTAREDTNKVKLLYDIGQPYENSQPEVAKQYYRQALQLSKKIGYTLGEVKYASNYTTVLNLQGNFDSSLAINIHALQLAKELNNPLAVVKTTLNTANSYNLSGKNDSALYYYMQTLPLLEKMANEQMLAVVYNNLTMIYRDIGQYQKGIEYGKKATPIFRTMKDSVNLEYNLTNLGVNYNDFKDYGQALSCFDEAFHISQKLGDKYAEASLYLNFGDIDYQQGKYEDSKRRFEQALKISRELNLSETETISLKGYGMYYLQTKNYTRAWKYADSALLIAQRNGIREQRLKIYKLLSDISYANQDLQSANAYDLKADQLNDSINNDNLQKVTTDYEKKYETAKKDDQIKEQQASLKQRRILNYLFAGIAAALFIIAGLGYRNFKHGQKLQQAKISELETEKKLAATEAVLQGEEQERTRLAKDLHDGLGGMLSGIKYSLNNMKENLIMTPDNAQAFARSIDMLDSSISEMRRVAHNMMPEMLVRYGLNTALKEFCNEVNRSGVIHTDYQSIGMDKAAIDQTVAVTLYRIVQELVNNSIKHAAAANVLVQVHLAWPEQLMTITVEDDGKGFDIALLKQSPGIGWNNIQNRVDFLKGKLDVNSAPGKGTSVLIEINV